MPPQDVPVDWKPDEKTTQAIQPGTEKDIRVSLLSDMRKNL